MEGCPKDELADVAGFPRLKYPGEILNMLKNHHSYENNLNLPELPPGVNLQVRGCGYLHPETSCNNSSYLQALPE